MYKKFSELLQSKHLRAADVARGTGLSQTVFSEWKKGKSKPKTDKLQKIAAYFDVPLEYFTDDAEVQDIKKLTPADSRSEVYEDLSKLSDSDLIKVEGFIKGLLAQDSSDK